MAAQKNCAVPARNLTCFVIRGWVRIFVCIVFSFLCVPVFAQRPAYTVEQVDDGFLFTQRLDWQDVPYTLRYEVTVERKTDTESYEASFSGESQKNEIAVSLSAGQYRYKVQAFNLLNKPAGTSDWIEFTVLKAVVPKIRGFIPESVILADLPPDKAFVLEISAVHLRAGTRIYLKSIGGQLFVEPGSVTVSEDGSHASVSFLPQSLKVGDYFIYAENPGGLFSVMGEFQVIERKPEKTDSAQEQLEKFADVRLWETFDDSIEGGKSVSSLISGTAIQSGIRYTRAIFTGTVAPDGAVPVPYAGFRTRLSAALSKQLQEANVLRFKTIGDGNDYTVGFIVWENGEEAWYTTRFKTRKGGIDETIISYSDFLEWKTGKPLADDLHSGILQIEFCTNTGFQGNFELSVFDLTPFFDVHFPRGSDGQSQTQVSSGLPDLKQRKKAYSAGISLSLSYPFDFTGFGYDTSDPLNLPLRAELGLRTGGLRFFFFMFDFQAGLKLSSAHASAALCLGAGKPVLFYAGAGLGGKMPHNGWTSPAANFLWDFPFFAGFEFAYFLDIRYTFFLKSPADFGSLQYENALSLGFVFKFKQ